MVLEQIMMRNMYKMMKLLSFAICRRNDMHILGTRQTYKANTNGLGKEQQNIILNDSRSKKN